MTRKQFLHTPALAAAISADTRSGSRLDLSIDVAEGLRISLRDRSNGIALAEGPYSYSFGVPRFRETRTGDRTVLLGMAPGGIRIRQEYRVPAGKPWIEERITIENAGPLPLMLPYGRGGFVLPVNLSEWEGFRFSAIPYRREPTGGRTQYSDYTMRQVLTEARYSRLRAGAPVDRHGHVNVPLAHRTGIVPLLYPDYASEGWCLTDGRRGYVITKYSQNGMEWAVLDRVPLDGRLGLRWGGFAIFMGDPEQGARIPPGASHTFGVTRITAYEGGLKEGFYTFRAEMEERGHGCPAGFDPPSHWNELYDNKLWWTTSMGGQDNAENRRKFYSLPDIKAEAAKAREYHCEALYLDPGWDTNFASKIWDEPRLGKMADFSAMLRRDYGLSLSLHTPLSGWCNPTSYSRECDILRGDGTTANQVLCGASKQYIEETARRLHVLARDGARFFMFDGTIYSGECFSDRHGHPVPAGREEYAAANNLLARLVHEKYPDVLIEMHDQLLGGTNIRHVPTYYGHGGAPRGFDTVWAYELMWDPMTDLVGGHSIALYYYNLAYSLPLYIHIDLRKDNAQALMLWWNISTCRHLGIGGTHAEPGARRAHQEAMAAYRRLKPFFASGTFEGIDELTHLHRHPSHPGAVVNCFNLEPQPVEREVVVAGRKHPVRIPAYGHSLLEIR